MNYEPVAQSGLYTESAKASYANEEPWSNAFNGMKRVN